MFPVSIKYSHYSSFELNIENMATSNKRTTFDSEFPYSPKFSGRDVSDMSLRARVARFRSCTKPGGNLQTK